MHDLLIVGGGPAGLNAALYAARGGLDALLFEQLFSGGQIAKTQEIDNYIGFPNGVASFELAMNMETQAKNAGAQIQYDEILSMQLQGKIKTLTTAKKSYEAKAVILCMGAQPRTLGVEGEERLRGKGVSYCATCDGALYKEKDVAVVGGGDTALEDALFLARYCKKVFLIHRRDRFRGAKILSDKVLACPNVELILDSVTEKIEGDDKVEKIFVRNAKMGDLKEMAVSGVFIAVGTKPNTELVKGQIQLEDGYVAAGEDTQTDCAGVFAAGDIRKKPLRQVITAASDGAVAVYSAMKYLDTAF